MDVQPPTPTCSLAIVLLIGDRDQTLSSQTPAHQVPAPSRLLASATGADLEPELTYAPLDPQRAVFTQARMSPTSARDVPATIVNGSHRLSLRRHPSRWLRLEFDDMRQEALHRLIEEVAQHPNYTLMRLE
ncbi:hypothetical protein BD626DRAFT_576189 [Schizophyllum amplum]|uniref:Uncharacterized protein n=1 Tax=Schizophyllum amplum TaxID=97359 RepID=A0A550BU04_9AGAR|nr:hypothetical protein BD626DRAFT_576189 [Auriculariopsis ampla]